MVVTNPATEITISFRPTKIKLFRSKKKSLLVVDGSCVNGSLNRIRPGNRALIHVRPSSSLPPIIADVDFLASELSIDEGVGPHLKKGCWVDADPAKSVVVKARANMERNRRGDRLVECTELLAVQAQDDDSFLPVNNDSEFREFRMGESGDDSSNPLDLKTERHVIFARWLVDAYGAERLSRGSGVIDVAGGNGMISRALADMGVRSTLLDPNPRHRERMSNEGDGADRNQNSALPPFGVIPCPLYGDGTDLTSRNDDVGSTIRHCSLVCGLHPDQATEPIVDLALRLDVPFAIVPCCVMPSLFPNRRQRRYNNDPVRSYSAFCRYLLDMAPSEEEFRVDYLNFVGRNKVIYRNTKGW